VLWRPAAVRRWHNIGQLTALIKTRLRRMQYRPGLLDGFLAKTGLDLSNPRY
jgi:putative transposase